MRNYALQSTHYIQPSYSMLHNTGTLITRQQLLLKKTVKSLTFLRTLYRVRYNYKLQYSLYDIKRFYISLR